MKVTQQMIKAANAVAPMLNANTIKKILEAALVVPEENLKPHEEIKKGLSPMSLLNRLGHNQSIVLLLPEHLTSARFQANMKAVQSKSNNLFQLETEKVFLFSQANPQAGVSIGLKCTVRRNAPIRERS